MKKDWLAQLPNLSSKKSIDKYMDRLDTKGVSRRDMLQLASAGAVASATALACGLPAYAIAAPSKKLGFMAWTASTEYNQLISEGASAAARDLGLSYAFFDGQLSSERQVNQYENLLTEGASGAFFNVLDPSALKRVSLTATKAKSPFGSMWAMIDWWTPYEASDYFVLFAVPDEDVVHAGVCTALYEAVMNKAGGGKVVALTGTEGNWAENVRTRARKEALKKFPKIQHVGSLTGKWVREEALRATQDLLTKHPDLVGIVAVNDDEAQGAIAAIRQAGLRPGVDIFVSGADGTSLGARAVAKGEMVATSGNSPVFTGALFTTRVFDSSQGWTPRASERMMYWDATVVTKANVASYMERYVDNKGAEPFLYKKMSKVLSPKDWDPQASMYPIDIDRHWLESPKPAGFVYPKDYLAAKSNGEWEKVRKEYADHYKIRFDGPSPNNNKKKT